MGRWKFIGQLINEHRDDGCLTQIMDVILYATLTFIGVGTGGGGGGGGGHRGHVPPQVFNLCHAHSICLVLQIYYILCPPNQNVFPTPLTLSLHPK